MSPFHLGMGILAAVAFGAWLGVLGTLSWLRRDRWQRAPGVLDLVRSRGGRLELDALDAANRGRGWDDAGEGDTQWP